MRRSTSARTRASASACRHGADRPRRRHLAQPAARARQRRMGATLAGRSRQPGAQHAGRPARVLRQPGRRARRALRRAVRSRPVPGARRARRGRARPARRSDSRGRARRAAGGRRRPGGALGPRQHAGDRGVLRRGAGHAARRPPKPRPAVGDARVLGWLPHGPAAPLSGGAGAGAGPEPRPDRAGRRCRRGAARRRSRAARLRPRLRLRHPAPGARDEHPDVAGAAQYLLPAEHADRGALLRSRRQDRLRPGRLAQHRARRGDRLGRPEPFPVRRGLRPGFSRSATPPRHRCPHPDSAGSAALGLLRDPQLDHGERHGAAPRHRLHGVHAGLPDPAGDRHRPWFRHLHPGESMRSHRFAATLLLALAAALPVPAQTEAFPAKPVRLIVPPPPGGGLDVLSRLMAAKLSGYWGQQMIVDNRPGAAMAIGTAAAAKAPADGYTVLFVNDGGLVINPLITRDTPYTYRDFAPIGLWVAVPLIITVNDAVPARNFPEFLGYLRANPGKVNFALADDNSRLASELFKSVANVDYVHVPYKGAAPTMNAPMAGEAQFSINQAGAPVNAAKARKVRMVAVTSAQRSKGLPQLPTAVESGLPAYVTGT